MFFGRVVYVVPNEDSAHLSILGHCGVSQEERKSSENTALFFSSNGWCSHWSTRNKSFTADDLAKYQHHFRTYSEAQLHTHATIATAAGRVYGFLSSSSVFASHSRVHISVDRRFPAKHSLLEGQFWSSMAFDLSLVQPAVQ